MPELALDPTETRRKPAPAVPGRGLLRPLLIGGVCAGALAGFAVAASSFMEDLVAPPRPARPMPVATSRASDWPDLKDGLPALAGAPKAEAQAAPALPPAPRMASVSNPMAFSEGPAGPVSANAKAIPDTREAAPPPPPPPPVAAKPIQETPTQRIPVPTDVALVPPAATAKPIMPKRVAALVMPTSAETVRAREEAAKKTDETPKPHEEAARPRPVAEKPASRPAPAVAATPAPEKARKAVAAHKPTPSPAAQTVKTANAEAEPEETTFLGVKLPSLAPAGRKLQEGVSALGDAVRNAF